MTLGSSAGEQALVFAQYIIIKGMYQIQGKAMWAMRSVLDMAGLILFDMAYRFEKKQEATAPCFLALLIRAISRPSYLGSGIFATAAQTQTQQAQTQQSYCGGFGNAPEVDGPSSAVDCYETRRRCNTRTSIIERIERKRIERRGIKKVFCTICCVCVSSHRV